MYRGIGILILLALVTVFYSTTRDRSAQHTKVFWILILITVLVVLGALFHNSIPSYEVYLLIETLYPLVYLLLLPIVLSVYTHLNFDKNAALALGFLVGISVIIEDVAAHYFSIAPWMVTILTFCLLVITTIWLRENKAFILDYLKLEEPNQAAEEPEPTDPFDHFVGD